LGGQTQTLKTTQIQNVAKGVELFCVLREVLGQVLGEEILDLMGPTGRSRTWVRTMSLAKN